jgi:hypothetical protein
MTRSHSAVVIALCLWCVAAVAATGRAAQPQASAATQVVPATYPPGQGRDVVIRVCKDCHAVTDINRRREFRQRWAGIVDAMTAHGASFDDADFEAMVSYLSVTFGRPIRINTASAAVIAEALDVTDELAAAIVKHRTAHGPFKDWEAVVAVPGVDAKRIEEQRVNLDFATGR